MDVLTGCALLGLMGVFFSYGLLDDLGLLPSYLFKHALKKNGQKRMDELFFHLLEVLPEAWVLEEDKMVYLPERMKNVKVVFTDTERLKIYYKDQYVAKFHHNSAKDWYGENIVDDSVQPWDEPLRYETLFEHLRTTYKTKTHEHQTSEEEKTQLLKEEKEKQLEREKIRLKEALQSPDFIETGEYRDYRITKSTLSGLTSVSLFYRDVRYVHATERNGNVRWELRFKSKEHYPVFHSLMDEIDAFLNHLLTPLEAMDSSIENDIQIGLSALQEEVKWLSEDDRHRVTVSYPNDIKRLHQTLAELEDPSLMEEEVASYLDRIRTSLEKMKVSVEKNKREAVRREGRIIEERTS